MDLLRGRRLSCRLSVINNSNSTSSLSAFFRRSVLLPLCMIALVLLVFCSNGATAQSSSALSIGVCITCRVGRVPHSLHAEYAARYYSSMFPNLHISTRLVGIYEPSGTTAIGLIRAWVVNATGCDVLIGPGSSSIAQAINPLVTTLWMDYSATATELSDKSSYPLFSRVVPNDAQSTQGAAKLIAHYNWHIVNTLCADNAYGRSVVSGVSAAVKRQHGQIGLARCVSTNDGEAEVEETLKDFLREESRVVFVGMSTSDAVFTAFLSAVLRLDAHKSLIFIFSESACSSNAITWQRITGSFCATFAVDSDYFEPFLQSYHTRNTSDNDAAYRAMGWPSLSQSDKYSTAVFPAFAHDASLFALHSYSKFYADFGRGPRTGKELVDFSHNQTVRGASGQIYLTPEGDHADADMVIVNAQPGNQSGQVGLITAGSTLVQMNSTIYWYGESTPRNDYQPNGLFFTTADGTRDEPDVSMIATVCAVAGLFLIGTPLTIVIVHRLGFKSKDNSCAPKDPNEPYTIVFTDIQASTTLWANAPEYMGAALDLHHRIVRELIEQHNGYEVKTIGDSFMVAFRQPGDAILFCLAVQNELYDATWPSFELDEIVRNKVLDSDGLVVDDEVYTSLWNGLRVRIGAHYGTSSITHDPISLGYDYYGNAVNVAARIEGVGHGGQILLSEQLYNVVLKQCVNALSACLCMDLGPQSLRGVSDPIRLYQVAPLRFRSRVFPPLRLEVENAHEEGEGSGDLHQTVGSNSVGATNPLEVAGDESDGQKSIATAAHDAVAPDIALVSRRLARNLRMKDEDLLHAHWNLFSVCLSPLKQTRRKEVILLLADAWRTTGRQTFKRWRMQEDAISVALLDIVARVSTVAVEATTQPGSDDGEHVHRGLYRGSSRMSFAGRKVSASSMPPTRVPREDAASARPFEDMGRAAQSFSEGDEGTAGTQPQDRIPRSPPTSSQQRRSQVELPRERTVKINLPLDDKLSLAQFSAV